MASTPEDHLCPICLHVSRNPVLLSCGQGLCKNCIWTRSTQGPGPHLHLCQSTDAVLSARDLEPVNGCESYFLQTAPGPSAPLCPQHSENLKLFCVDHQEPACVICTSSELHSHHTFRPLNEAAPQARRTLLQLLETKSTALKKAKMGFYLAAEHIRAQAQHTEQKIKEQLQRFQELLEEEGKSRIRALWEEERQKSGTIKEKIEALNRDVESLSDSVKDAEKVTEDVSFLLHFKATKEKVQRRFLLDLHQLPTAALMEEAKHLGNLNFNIWMKMKDLVSYSPVVLDPNTAGSLLMPFKDLTSLTKGGDQMVPDCPERFTSFFSILGSEGFASGTHSWDVEVRDNIHWEVGVSESVHEATDRDPQIWRLCFFCDNYTTKSPSAASLLTLQREPQKIRVTLDMSGGTVSFCDADTDAHIHRFCCSFTLQMFPYFHSYNHLKLLPVDVSVEAGR